MLKKFTNGLLILFISSILVHYAKINPIFYLVFIVFLIKSVHYFFSSKDNKNSYNSLIIIIIFFLIESLFISLANFYNIDTLDMLRLIIIYLLFFIFLIYIKKYGLHYINEFYLCLRRFGNLIALINIIEIVRQKSIFYQFLKGNSVNWQTASFGTDAFRTFSIFAHPIAYATFLMCLFWVNIFMPIKNKTLKYIIIINILVNIYFTKSRSIWIALIITILLYLCRSILSIVKRKNLRIKTINVIFVAFGIIITILLIFIFRESLNNIYYSIYSRFITVTNDSYNDASRIQRLDVVNLIINYMLNNGLVNFLFGNGYGTVGNFLLNSSLLLKIGTTDSQYASIFYEFGFVGLVSFAFIIVYCIYLFFKDINNMKRLSILIFITIAIVADFSEIYGWPNIMFMMFLSLAIISTNNQQS